VTVALCESVRKRLANEAMNLTDLGVVVIGPVVQEVSCPRSSRRSGRAHRVQHDGGVSAYADQLKNHAVSYIPGAAPRSCLIIPTRGLPPAPKTETHPRDKLAKAGDRMKTTKDFIRGSVSKSFLSGKPYLVKFVDGHAQPAGEWLRARLAEVRGNKR
jgi:Family of unknown function (DUF5329)